MEEKITAISDKINAGGKNIVFTGAGISTENIKNEPYCAQSKTGNFSVKIGRLSPFRGIYIDLFDVVLAA